MLGLVDLVYFTGFRRRWSCPEQCRALARHRRLPERRGSRGWTPGVSEKPVCGCIPRTERIPLRGSQMVPAGRTALSRHQSAYGFIHDIRRQGTGVLQHRPEPRFCDHNVNVQRAELRRKVLQLLPRRLEGFEGGHPTRGAVHVSQQADGVVGYWWLDRRRGELVERLPEAGDAEVR